MTKDLWSGVPDLFGLYSRRTETIDTIDYGFNERLSRNLKGMHVKYVLDVVKIGGAFTLSEITDRIYDKYNFKSYSSLKGRVNRTIRYLEQEGYISFLPDRNNELTVCIYWYFYNIRKN